MDAVGVTWGYASDGELEAAGAVEIVDDVRTLAAVVLRRLRDGAPPFGSVHGA